MIADANATRFKRGTNIDLVLIYEGGSAAIQITANRCARKAKSSMLTRRHAQESCSEDNILPNLRTISLNARSHFVAHSSRCTF
jgi:hypothetical protein